MYYMYTYCIIIQYRSDTRYMCIKAGSQYDVRSCILRFVLRRKRIRKDRFLVYPCVALRCSMFTIGMRYAKQDLVSYRVNYMGVHEEANALAIVH